MHSTSHTLVLTLWISLFNHQLIIQRIFNKLIDLVLFFLMDVTVVTIKIPLPILSCFDML